MNISKQRKTLIAIISTLALFGIFNAMQQKNANKVEVPTIAYSDFVAQVAAGRVERVEFEERTLFGVYKKENKEPLKLENKMDMPPALADKGSKGDKTPSQTQAVVQKSVKAEEKNEAMSKSGGITVSSTDPLTFQFKTLAPNDPSLIGKLLSENVLVYVRPPNESGMGTAILFSFGPMILFLLVYIWLMKRMSGGKGGANPFSFGKSRAKLIKPEENKVTWNDVKGVDEAKESLMEIVDFLKTPGKFRELGGKIPKGVLLTGSPGCGKTHLSRALANEAGARFFTLSGSDFVEMFVGVGASRVRDLFAEARKVAPSIIFIDEIDAVGRQRGAGVGGGNDEREQTLNALLVEMDGFDQSGGVIVIAATNRPDVLDAALLRPGRFDRQVVVPLPDIQGRTDILDVYLKQVPMAIDVSSSVIARSTPGFSGADLANLVNEAALFAARRDKKFVDMSDFESAKDKIVMGAERKSTGMSEEERKNTAYHESGHAIVSMALTKTDPVHKVTIVPRGRALGVTMMIPERDQYGYDREELKQKIAVLLGGRLAEELFLKSMSTGASDDIRRATDLARKMVTTLGMSEVLGPIRYAEEDGEVFLGRSMGSNSHAWSGETQKTVDEEVKKFVMEGYKVAKEILTGHQDEVHAMSKFLLEKETIGAEDCAVIMGAKKGAWTTDTTDMTTFAIA